MRYCSVNKAEIPKQWELQGSNYPIAMETEDDSLWVTISKHNEEKAWKNGEPQMFEVKGVNKAYRLFRIKLEENWSEEYPNILSFSGTNEIFHNNNSLGFEMFGDLVQNKF